MLFKPAFALLAIWLLGRPFGMVSVYRVGDLAHVFLLAGVMFVARCAQGARRRSASAQPAD